MKESSHLIKEKIKKNLENNFELKKLYKLHQDLNEKIEALTNRSFRTSDEEAKLKSMKVQKLSTMESMIALLPAD